MEDKNQTYTKKQFLLTISNIILLFPLGIALIALGTIFQENGNDFLLYLFVVIGILCWIGDIVFMFMNMKKLMHYEFERKFEKVKDLEQQKLGSKQMEFNEDVLESLLLKIKHKKVSEKLFWIFFPNYWTKHTSFFLTLEHNLNMAEALEEEEANDQDDADDDLEEESDFTEEEMEKLQHEIPKKAYSGVVARVLINVVDSLDAEQKSAGEKIITNQQVVSKALGMFAPINLYYIYDLSTKILYYEPYKRYRMYPRPRAVKKFNKLLGILEE